ncbi:MAG TPA: DUF4389 domain-containing protein [Gaiellaceae bacterium]|nr:DUF4389 domain-containing protein [Gaiellaceae bacterium]
MQPEHPVRLVVRDDLERRRLTVFFRLLLAIPHFVWIFLWSIAVFFASIANWVATLVRGTPAQGLHRFMCAYVRYGAHLGAYIGLVANPYPAFTGEEGGYPIDVRLPEPTEQGRWSVFFRFFIALPALLLTSATGGGGPRFNYGLGGGRKSYSGGAESGGLLVACGFLGWFASLAHGRMPKGLRDAGAYSVGYSAQATAYLLLVTDRYPNADPTAMLADVDRPPEHPVRLVGDPHDLRRSRVTVFFRLLLTIPHIVWLTLWGVAFVLALIANWVVTLFRGTPAHPLHRFSCAYLRQRLHVLAFLTLTTNPFPGFVGEMGRYPLDLELPEPARQNRWKTGFRILLAVPALVVSSALSGALFWCAVLTWFYALARGSATWGLRNLAAYALRYDAQVNAYVALVTEAYPHASPLEGAPTPQHEFADTT